MSKKVLAGGLQAGDIVYTTFNGKKVVKGERGLVLGPCRNPKLERADEKVLVHFEPGSQPDHIRSWTWMTDMPKELNLNALTQLRHDGEISTAQGIKKKKKSATVSATQASKRGPAARSGSAGITPLGVASALDAVDPVTGVVVGALSDVAPELVTALGLRETGASLARCVQLVNRAPGVIGKLIAGASRALSKAAFMRGDRAGRGMRKMVDAAGQVALDAAGGLDLDSISAFGFLWTLAKLSGLRDVLVTILKMPCELLHKCIMTIPLGGKLWAAVNLTLNVPVTIVRLALENVYHPLMEGVSGALEPVVGLCGGVVCTAGVLPLVVGGGVEGVVSLTGDGVATILWGAGEVIEGILGPIGTPIKLVVNGVGFVVDNTLKATGMIVGGVLSLPFLMGQAMMSVMD